MKKETGTNGDWKPEEGRPEEACPCHAEHDGQREVIELKGGKEKGNWQICVFAPAREARQLARIWNREG